MEFQRPSNVPDHADLCLKAISDAGLGDKISLGGALYPDVAPPTELATLADRVDFLARLSAAADFGVLPWPDTVEEIRKPAWREAVDACRLLTSPTYHLLRRWQGLPPLPYLGQQLAYIRDDPNLRYV